MAYNFDSAQFNRESTPKRLGNWEVPRWSPTRARNLEYRPNPKPICDISGHFLPGAPRGTSKCFGHFTGTWELPRKITRKVAEELAQEPPPGRFPDWLNLRVQRPKVTARLRVPKREKEKKQDAKAERIEAEQSFKDSEQDDSKGNAETGNQYETNETGNQYETNEASNQSKTNEEVVNYLENREDPLELNETKKPVDQDGNAPYVPGSLTEPENRHESYDLLVKKAVEDIHGPQEEDHDKFWRKVAENAKHNERKSDDMKCKKTTLKLPDVNVSQNFQFAKKMHVVNLEHQPLPDTLGYRNLSKVGEHRDSDIVVKPYAISWKGYGAAGPTCCTKMRVHRPKTCDTKKLEPEQEKRPSTSAPNLGGQYKKSMSPMDLAICWDFRPSHTSLEPKPPKHIDGTNGSKAPAVFTMVHTPKEEDEPFQPGHANPIFTQNQATDNVGRHAVPYFEKDMSKERRKNSCDVQHCPQHVDASEKMENAGSRRNSAQKPPCDGIQGCGTPGESRKSSRDFNNRPDKLQPIKQAWNSDLNGEKNRSRNSLESYEKTPLAQGKLHQSSPNDSQTSRRSTKDSEATNNNGTKHKHCLSCNGTKPCQDTKLKEDYKFAFKAGNPNSVQSNGSSTDSKGIKVPKMRHPYTKKSYTIPTLAPPFSIWKDANATGYPEHWRLASVYQHAYKPPEQRRKALVTSVYQ